MRTKAILFGTLIILFQLFFIKPVKAGWICGIPNYQATVNINAKKCATNFGGTKRCDNNGSWHCNGTYQCNGFSGGGASCHRTTNSATCQVNVFATADCTASDCFTGCDISPDGFTCNERKDTQSTGCNVFVPDVTNTPTSTPGSGPTNTPGPGPTNTPTPPPSDIAPIGNHDAPNVASCTMQGWACDQNLWSDKINIHFYEGANYIGSYVAQDASEPGVVAACGNTPNHRFNFTLPLSYNSGSLYNGSPHSITAYALGVNGAGVENGNNPSLPNNPRSITCACPAPATPPIPTATSVCAATSSVSLTWSGGPYSVYREGVTPFAAATLVGSGSGGITDNGVTCGNSYRYKLRNTAVCGAITESGWSATVTAQCNPAAPASINATDGNYTSTTITWPTVSGATKYVVNRNNVYFAPDITHPTATTTDTSCLGAGAPYSYTVQSVRGTCVSAFTAPNTGYCLPNPNWYQSSGGDVTANGTISNSQMPASQITVGIVTGTTINWGSNAANQLVQSAIHSSVISNNNYNALYNAAVVKAGANMVTSSASSLNINSLSGTAVGGVVYVENNAANLTLTASTLNKNMVLIYSGSGTVTITGNILITAPATTFVLLAKGNVTVDRTVGNVANPITGTDNLQGIYVAGGVFSDTNGDEAGRTLRINGSVVGLGGVSLGRQSSTGTYPKDYFLFNPGYVVNMPSGLKLTNKVFSESAP